jgi:hypothetical protein
VVGEVKSCTGAGVVVHLVKGLGFCPLTGLHDQFVPNALEGISAGQFVRAQVQSESLDSKGRIPLSLKQKDGGEHAGTCPFLFFSLCHALAPPMQCIRTLQLHDLAKPSIKALETHD